MKKLYKYIPACIVAFMFAAVLLGMSCTEQISITTRAGESRLVIYGTMSTDTMPRIVRISRTAGYFDRDDEQIHISDAIVSISDGHDWWSLYETEQKGSYQTIKDVRGIEGRTYTLTVTLDFDGDGVPETYRAQSTMPPAASIDSVAVRESVMFDERLELLLWAAIPDDQNYYLSFHYSVNTGDYADSLSNYTIIQQRHIGSDYIEGIPAKIINLKDEEVYENDLVWFYADVLSAGYGKFLSSAQKEYKGGLPFFSGPPANIETNIELVEGTCDKQPLGYFGAYATCRRGVWIQSVF